MRDLDTRSRFTRERSPDSSVTRVSAGCPFVKDASYPTHADTLRMLTATQMPAHPMRDRESQRERDGSIQAGRAFDFRQRQRPEAPQAASGVHE